MKTKKIKLTQAQCKYLYRCFTENSYSTYHSRYGHIVATMVNNKELFFLYSAKRSRTVKELQNFGVLIPKIYSRRISRKELKIQIALGIAREYYLIVHPQILKQLTNSFLQSCRNLEIKE